MGFLQNQGQGQAPVGQEAVPQDPTRTQEQIIDDPDKGGQVEDREGTMGGGIPGSTDANAEEQSIYEKVVMAGMKILFDDEKTRPAVINKLKAQKGNPAQSIADLTIMLMLELDKKSGGKIPETVILPAASELLEQISELAESANLFPVDQAVMNYAAQLMVVGLGKEYGVEPEDIDEIMSSMSTNSLRKIEDEQGNYARKQPGANQNG